MNAIYDVDFDWDDLIERIECNKIIPVIGNNLYWIEQDGKEVPLYDYLADKMTEKIRIEPIPDVSMRFPKAAFEFLKKKGGNYLKLSKFLNKCLEDVELVEHNPLMKLARINGFRIFINTGYDNFLLNTLKRVRKYPVEELSYTLREKKLNKLDDDLFEQLEEGERTLVYNIYGNLKNKIDSAFTEKDILETIVEFQKDMKAYPENNLFQELRESSLLFIGCGYDDWLFRFFIRTLSNEPYRVPKDPYKLLFAIDDLQEKAKDPFEELPKFLSNYETEIYIAPNVVKFVEAMFEQVEEELPEAIIQPEDFPGFAFVSFHGANRAAAVQLATVLREDGIDVWLDEKKFKPGDEVDETIAKAIDKCPVFIPLISKETQNLQGEGGVLKYHCREWEWAFGSMKAGDNPKHIVPVNIDGIDWIYDKFAGLFYVTVKDGHRVGGYDDLKEKLLDIQRQING